MNEKTETLSQKLKNKIIEGLTRKPEELDKVALRAGRDKWTKRELAKELEDETERGISIMDDLLSLTIDLVSRDKMFL